MAAAGASPTQLVEISVDHHPSLESGAESRSKNLVPFTCSKIGAKITQILQHVKAFARVLPDSRQDMDTISRELISTSLCVETLQNDSAESVYPGSLQDSLVGALQNCDSVIEQMQQFLGNLDSEQSLKTAEQAGLGESIQWTTSTRIYINKLRISLEAHRSAIYVAIEMSLIIKTPSNQYPCDHGSNAFLSTKTGSTEISVLIEQIHALQSEVAQFRSREVRPDMNQSYLLEKFLDESSMYAESIAIHRTAEPNLAAVTLPSEARANGGESNDGTSASQLNAGATDIPAPPYALSEDRFHDFAWEEAKRLNSSGEQHLQAQSLEVRREVCEQSIAPIKLHLGMFEIGKSLGKARFGGVYLARERSNNFVCVLKVLRRHKIEQSKAERSVRREIEIQGNLRHLSVLRLYSHFHDNDTVVIVLEYAHGNLSKHLRRNGPFPEWKAAQYIAQIATGLQYLHRKHVIHRNIRPENILVDIHGFVKISGFGLSVHSPSARRNTVCGTLDYLAPEMIERGDVTKNIDYSREVDLWALGVLTYEILTGKVPFEDVPAVTKTRIISSEVTVPSFVSSEARDLIERLLILEPEKRLLPEEVLRHPWIIKHQGSSTKQTQAHN